jgi:hypothetical protein
MNEIGRKGELRVNSDTSWMADYPTLFGTEEEINVRIDELMRSPARKPAKEIEEYHVNVWLQKAWRQGWYTNLRTRI